MKLLPKNWAARVLTIWAAIAIVCVGGYYGARHVAWPAYRGWREARLNRMARKFLAEGNVSDALITVRRNLRANQSNLETWRLAVEVAKAKDSPEAIGFLDHIVKAGGTLAERLELVRLALHYGYVRQAVDALDGAGAEARDSADFHALAAEAYRRVGRLAAAKLELYSLVALRPHDGAAQLSLAQAEFNDDRDHPDLALRAKVEQLAEDPALHVRALALLLDDALARHAAEDAAKFAERLEPDTQTTAQELQVLAGFELGAPDHVAAYRKKLDGELARDPDGAAEFVRYLTAHHRLAEAQRWFAALPDQTRAAPAPAQALGEALFAAKDWAALGAHLDAYAWGDHDYLRQAFIAYVDRQTGHPADAQEAWKFASAKAGDSIPKLADLVTRASDWGWNDDAAELLRRVFNLMPRNESVRNQLIAWERMHGNTIGLNRVFARVVEVEPDNRDAKNNLAYTSLLLGTNLARAYGLARELHAAEPDNPFYATTESLALYKQGKPDDALALLAKLPPAALSGPERAVLRALYEAAAGDTAQAQGLLAGIARARLLPEESALATQAGDLIAGQTEAHDTRQRLLAQREKNREAGRHGWLHLLPDAGGEVPAPLQSADTLFAADDLQGLNAFLHGGNWGPNEPLRFALLAYVDRKESDAVAAREDWRLAVSSAGGDLRQLNNLIALATAWEWRDERMDALDRRFARDASDPAQLAELVEYYRAAGRTADMARVLGVFVDTQPATPAQQGAFAYYSMLCNQNLTRAYVVAQKSYQDAPDQPGLRAIYAFSLWKQQRYDEAWTLLDRAQAADGSIVPLPLLQAAVLADLKRAADAVQYLNGYERKDPLPEETSLAASLRRRLSPKDAGALSAAM